MKALPFLALLALTGQIVTLSVENFSRHPAGSLPIHFKTWPFHREKAKKIYRIADEEGNRYLAADDGQNFSEQIYFEFHWKADAYPHLKWRWRARALPAGAAENVPSKNDSACSIYILFGKTTGTALKYTWSTTLAAGTVHMKKPGKMAIKVLDSGGAHLGQWRWHSLNVPGEYQKLLGAPMPRNPTGIAILTDGNAVGKPSACDYDDFMISAKP